MCHINILYVYVFHITSSVINIHVVQRVGGCRAISTSPRPGGTAEQRGRARVRPGAAAASPAFPFGTDSSPSAPVPCAGDRQGVPRARVTAPAALLGLGAAPTHRPKGQAANSWIRLPHLLISWPAPIAAASGHLV